jgi:hypothetical protein
MDYAWYILGNGRRGYIERTIASWLANLSDKPKYSYIFDDSGDPEHVKWLLSNYGQDFTVVPISSEVAGQAIAVQKIFDTLRELDVDYFLGIEEDWMLFRPLDVQSVIYELCNNPHIIQMRVPRTVWHSEYHRLDLDAGSLLLHHLNDDKGQVAIKRDHWYETRGHFYFWAHNPSVFHRRVLDNKYPNTPSHEYDFGIQLLKLDSSATVGFWADNPYDGYITHIGFRDEQLLKSLPRLHGWAHG